MQKAFETLPSEFISATKICDYKTPISGVLGKIKSLGGVVVFKGKEYYGIVDSRTIANMGVLKMDAKFPIGKFAKKVPLLDQSTSIEKSIHYFFNSATKSLPYTEGGKIKGVIKREMLLRAILSLHMVSSYKAGYAMSAPVVAIDKESSVSQAKSTMESRKVNKIIVVDGGKIFGILSYNDILSEFTELNARQTTEKKTKAYLDKIGTTSVSDICSRQVYRIDHSRPIEEAIKSMIELKISSLLVTKADKPVGILTVRDVFELVTTNTSAVAERIFISGLNSRTKEFEDEIKVELEKLADKVDRFGNLKTDYISLHIKNPKAKNYEMKGRLSLSKGGTISASSSGFSLDDTLSKLVDNLYREVKVKKEIILGSKKGDREEYE
ncbi:MAG: CBS domain-containing protein [Candidatus Micrarchaeota archaeon]|nr:CBS domain-containing protein [Candidatus Micrarchaeota archaeon]